MPPSSDIAALLVSAGMGALAGQSGWGIYIGTEPAKPDTTITLYDIPGAPPIRDAELRHPAIHIRVRGAPHDYPGAYAKSVEVWRYIDSLSVVTVGSTTYSAIARGEPSYLEHDESQRPIFISDYDLLRSEA